MFLFSYAVVGLWKFVTATTVASQFMLRSLSRRQHSNGSQEQFTLTISSQGESVYSLLGLRISYFNPGR